MFDIQVHEIEVTTETTLFPIRSIINNRLAMPVSYTVYISKKSNAKDKIY